MKRQKTECRFYLWDYLWWHGERWQQLRPASRADGSMAVFLFIMALIIVPLIFLFYSLFPEAAIIHVIAWCLVILAGHSWINRIYRRRGKAVLKHYAKRSFHPIAGIMLFIIPIAMIMAWMWWFAVLQQPHATTFCRRH